METQFRPFLKDSKCWAYLVVMRFASYLRHYSTVSALPFPLNLFFSTHIGEFTTVLGLGVLFIAVGVKEFRQNLITKILLVSAVVSSACILALSQLGGRFFFEPYLWVIAAVAGASWSPLKNLLFKIMIVQLCLMAILSSLWRKYFIPWGIDRLSAR